VTANHVLVVDDESGVRDVLKRYLEREGYSVLLAENGPDAMRLIERERQTIRLWCLT
jgi:two-component system response regulator (stage 0 sporulation protein F)